MQITIRGMDPELEEAIRRLSHEEGISLNKAAIRLLARGAHLDRPAQRTVGHDLDHLFGTWTEAEAEAFRRTLKTCEQVDPDFWK
jgi:hypothetical protein